MNLGKTVPLIMTAYAEQVKIVAGCKLSHANSI